MHGIGQLRICLAAATASAVMLATPGRPQAPTIVPLTDSVLQVRPGAVVPLLDPADRRPSALPLEFVVSTARFYIQQSRITGDLGYLNYAESLLAPWILEPTPEPRALLLHATVQQSRHEFPAALATLDRALALRSTDSEAWLTRADILRVMGMYAQAGAACERFAQLADPSLSALFRLSLRSLNGELPQAYAALVKIPIQDMRPAERAWVYATLGEMAVRLGRDADAERWFLRDLRIAPYDFFGRAAYADLLLRHRRAAQVLVLVRGHRIPDPLLLRVAIAQKMLGDAGLSRSVVALQVAFRAEAQRGESVHQREQARFLLEVQKRPRPALAVALENWKVQREPEDALILVKAAASAGNPQAAQPALDFLRANRLRDARLSDRPAVNRWLPHGIDVRPGS